MKLLIRIVVLFALFFLFVRYLEKKSIFFPQKQLDAYPDGQEMLFEDVYFKTVDDQLLNGWFFRHPQAQATMLFFHGNAGNISHRLEKVKIFYQLGLNIFIVDYRGYGKSQGTPTEEGLYKDALAAFDYLVKRKDLETGRIVGYGESLGGVAAVHLAAHRPLAALIVDSSFSSAADMARQYYPWAPSFLLKTKMDSAKTIRSVHIPKLFIHSKDDEIVPFKLAQKLFAAAAQPKTFLEISGDHNGGYELSKEKYIEGIKGFLKQQGWVQ